MGLLTGERYPGMSLFHNIPLRLKKAFYQKSSEKILFHSHAERDDRTFIEEDLFPAKISRLVRLHVPPQICHC